MPTRIFTKKGCSAILNRPLGIARTEGGLNAGRLVILSRYGAGSERLCAGAQGERAAGRARRMGAKRDAFAGAGSRQAPVLRTADFEARRHLLAGRAGGRRADPTGAAANPSASSHSQ